MKSLTRTLCTAFICLASTAVCADAGAQALVQTSAAGACSQTSSASAYDGGFIVASNATSGATFQCGIDVAASDIDDVESAEAFVVDVSATSNAWAQLCVRSIVTGTKSCGAAVYSAGNASGIQTLTPLMPAGDFDDTYLAYLSVYVPKPSNPGYAYFWGFRILAD